ncbi:HyaD/HybD family hydrogenase maturation endopeptidase [Thermodesulfovibrionales bacterium]|nr:HyaD/HybD family hydrogenase maturation endopeptidase [Thermodesulfovibrionales bacterium]MCL0051827.1 HyaD/HybD family hydrogenase maturation endopeptidase [Thermodesulfovibrionales bacterium]MCL0071329.1 HyaD/HybD family hydrogenase maturation endopeptidase [Thermodesulfovibrionales bacterium]
MNIRQYKISVIGLGNILLRDEGVGVHVVNAIKQRYIFPPEVEIIDGGTTGLDLLPFFEGKDKILIVDAADFGKEPGHIEIVEDKNIPSLLSPNLSTHHVGLSDLIFAAEALDMRPLEICLIGIQPKFINVGLDMTDEMNEKLDTLVEMSIEKLKAWNVECVLQYQQELSK